MINNCLIQGTQLANEKHSGGSSRGEDISEIFRSEGGYSGCHTDSRPRRYVLNKLLAVSTMLRWTLEV